MQIVIDMDDNLYHRLLADKYKGNPEQAWVDITDVLNAIHKGTPLSKGHGRLIDADKFIENVQEDRKHSCYVKGWTADDVLDYLNPQSALAPTIIEADR